MAAGTRAYDNVQPEELEEARRYSMEVDWSSEDEVFVVRFPDAPGVMTHGNTREEAVAQGEDAIITWLTAHHDAGLPVPQPRITVRNAPAPPSTPSYKPDDIRQIRRKLDVSQGVFADVLNVSRGAVRSWEQGARQPEGAAMRLISIADRHPEILLGWDKAPLDQSKRPACNLKWKRSGPRRRRLREDRATYHCARLGQHGPARGMASRRRDPAGVH